MNIIHADYKDLKKILELQYIAYQSEAILNNNFSIPPLTQTMGEIEKEYQSGIFLKAIDENEVIIGSVRGTVKDNTMNIGKLMVHPDYQGKGIGTKLLLAIEKVYPTLRCELFTSSKSVKNLGLYEKLGYTVFRQKQITPDLTFVYLEKNSKNRL